MVDDIALDRCFHILADPTRRAMLARLAHGQARVTDLAASAPAISMQAVSKHLALMERAGFIRRRKSGREVWCEARDDGFAAAQAWIERTRTFWAARLEELAAIAEREEADPA